MSEKKVAAVVAAGGGGVGAKKEKKEEEEELTVEDFDPIEKAEKERKLYNNRNATEMYYPQEISHFHPCTGDEALPWKFNESQKCDLCGVKSPPMRHVPGWTYWCVSCMKNNGFGRADPKVVAQRTKAAGLSKDEVEFLEAQKTLPEEILQQIMCYLPSFHDMCNCARVSHKWMNSLNYAASDESDLMKVKRKLLAKELYIVSKSKDEKRVELAQNKLRQLELAPLLGEWQIAHKQRRLALCRLLVTTKYYSSQLGIKSARYPAFDLVDSPTCAEVIKREKDVTARSGTGDKHCGVVSCRDMVILAPGKTTRNGKNENGVPYFEIECDSETLERIVVFIDSETGWIVTYDKVGKAVGDEKDKKNKKGAFSCLLQ